MCGAASMYYFDLLEILRSHPEKRFTAIELYMELQKNRQVNLCTMKLVISKMSLKHPNVHMEKINVEKPGQRYVVHAYYFGKT